MNDTQTTEEVTSVRDFLQYYADRGYTVDSVSIDHTVPGSQPKRNEVAIELTLTEPIDSVVDRLETTTDDS